jgi:tRNA pseudouridine32 synthase/23S rRNA pseudouridine746 synthase
VINFRHDATAPLRPAATPAAGPPRVLFQDNRFVVLDKPAGLPAHRGRSGGRTRVPIGRPVGGPSVEDWFPLLSRRRDGPWLVHRLDADTAGCLLIALRKTPLVQAQAVFAAGRAVKRYWAVVRGGPGAGSGVIDQPIGRQGSGGAWRMVPDPAGQAAVTAWRVLGRGDGLAWLELAPRTGRTHQIRVHCAAAGWPILGDAQYGGGGGSMHLLARALHLPLDPPVSAAAEPPAAMRAALRLCGWADGVAD